MDDGATGRRGGNLAEIQRQVRIDLAAAHRIAYMHRLHEGIANHLTARVPGCDDRYYQLPYGIHWAEAKASHLMEVGWDGVLLVGEGNIEFSTYTIHSPIHRLNPDADVVLHTHMPYASTLARMEDTHLRAVGMNELAFIADTAYDVDYPGLPVTNAEGERLTQVLGDKRAMIMAGHGVLAIGKSVADAYYRLYNLERTCRKFVQAVWTGRELHEIRPDVVTASAAAYQGEGLVTAGRPHSEWQFDMFKRLVDRDNPGYAN